MRQCARRSARYAKQVLAEGRAEGLRHAITTLCRACEIELDSAHEAALEAMNAADPEALQDRLLRDQAWG